MSLDQLTRICEAATPGPWTCKEGSTSYPECEDKDFWSVVLSPAGREIVTLHERYSMRDDDRRDYDFDATFIATFDPPTAMKLVRAAKEGLELLSALKALVGIYDDEFGMVAPEMTAALDAIVKAEVLRGLERAP